MESKSSTQYNVSTKGKHNNSMSSYTDSDVPINAIIQPLMHLMHQHLYDELLVG